MAITRFAHSAYGVDSSQWHVLEDHLLDVGARTEHIAKKLGASGYGTLAGCWHDIGKYPADWQSFISSTDEDSSISDGEVGGSRKRGPDHSTAGAIHALRRFGKVAGLPLQFVIAGHHAGLADREALRVRLGDPGKLVRYEMTAAEGNPTILDLSADLIVPSPINDRRYSREQQGRRFEMFVRMLFSALVDSDFLDTEAFFERLQPAGRGESRRSWPRLSDYASKLAEHIDRLCSQSRPSRVNTVRADVLQYCREASTRPPGVHTLTVPTGGGKTLSSLDFALRHAVHTGLDRVIIALPYLSIIDQTASTFRDVFSSLGPNTIVEHHSSITPTADTVSNRLASENWDAPLVVTTQVQLFESLFARLTSSCRKLHNMARSVIVLDEVQTLPVKYLDPILDALQQLTDTYGSSVLLMTATQPGLAARALGAAPFAGLSPPPVEIVPSEHLEAIYSALRRVRVHWPRPEHRISYADLAAMIRAHRQVLAIVDTRRAARDLTVAVGDECDSLHLSARMCAAHRRKVITEVRRRLGTNSPCRVISTQLIEAGVDVDFPVVFKAMAGLDSIAQAAGRCNREGALECGDVFVFLPENDPPSSLKHRRDLAALMVQLEPELDLTLPSAYASYFDRLYAHSDRDGRRIQRSRVELKFETVARDFRMIDDLSETVFVPFGEEGRRAIDAVRFAGPSRERLRSLQVFGVSISQRELAELMRVGAVETISDTVHVLVSSIHYSDRFGILVAGVDNDFLSI